MLERNRNINFNRFNNVTYGFIILSSKFSREEYIKNCIATNTVTVVTSMGTIYNNCPIKNFEEITFPEKIGQRGTMVLLIRFEYFNRPLVVNVIPQIGFEFPKVENEFQNKKTLETEECIISTDIDVKDGSYLINIFGKKIDKSKFKISVGSLEKDAKAEIKVEGDATIEATNKITLNSMNELEINIKDKTKQDKFNKVLIKLNEGIIVSDEYDNTIKMNNEGIEINSSGNISDIKINNKGKLNVQVEKDANIDVKGKTNLKSQGEIKIDSNSIIKIGDAESFALNESSICQYSGQRHLPPITNIKVKV